MTGPEHYRTSDELLEVAERNSGDLDFKDPESVVLGVRLIANTIAQAQVHATLALASATAALDPSPNNLAHWSGAMPA